MKIKRTLPPAAAPIRFRDLVHGVAGIFAEKRRLKQLEPEIQEYFGVKHAFFVSSGKAALTLILVALKSLSSRRQVLIPAYTCFSVPSAVVKAGLNVSLCDIDPETLDFNFECLEGSVDEGTLCVIPTHLLGLPSDVDRVKALCKGKGVFVVEDAAQAMGVKDKGRLLGTLGDAAFLSLGRGKNITCGSGGIIVTNSDPIAQAIRIEYAKLQRETPLRVIRNLCEVLVMGLLLDPRVYWFPAGLPFLKLGETQFYHDFPIHRIDGLRAGLLTHWQERLKQSNSARYRAAKYFIDHLAAGSQVIRSPSRGMITYLRLPLMMKNKKAKDELCALSEENGLGISPFYPTAISAIKELKERFEQKEFPAAALVADRLVTFPVHHLVRQNDSDKICGMLSELHDATPEAGLSSSVRDLGK